MRFLIEQDLDGPLDQVEMAFFEPAFLERLADLPKLGQPELIGQERDGDTIHQQVRYHFTGDLNAAVTRVIDPAKLTWIEDATFYRPAHRTDWRVVPDHYADRLCCSGYFQLSASGQQTHRVARGELTVRMPLVGSRVERAIVSGLREHAEGESWIMAEWLATRPTTR